MPARKEDYKNTFNKLWSVDVEWDKLNLEDLIKLAVIWSEPELILSKLGVEAQKEISRRRLVEVGLDWIEDRVKNLPDEVKDRPLVKLTRKVFGLEEARKEQEK